MRRLERLREERDAVVVAHSFQRPEVQEIADFAGGKLECALFAAESSASTVVVCGVDFMAELVAVLCPGKRVLLAEPEAKCPMVAMLEREQLLRMRERLPAVFVGYVKARAEQLELCDFVCTHESALQVVEGAEGEVVVVPDSQVAEYLRMRTGRRLIGAEAYCPPHIRITPAEVKMLREAHPEAEVLAHPQCRRDVLELADAVLDSAGMVEHAAKSPREEFIVACETGVLHRLRACSPEKSFYPASERAVCSKHRLTDASSVLWCLEDMSGEVRVEEEKAARLRELMRRGGAIG